MALPVRKPIKRRGARRARRRRRLLTRWRILGVLLMVGAGAGYQWLTTADEFRLDDADVQLSGLRYTDTQLVRTTLAEWLSGNPNVFTLPAADIERALSALPAVADSDVNVILPSALVVSVTERVPVFTWHTRTGDFLVDGEGVLLRAAAAEDPLAGFLPVVDDDRQEIDIPDVGGSMERVDLEAVLKLAAVDPALAGSSAEWIGLSADDENGYVLSAEPDGWRAVFGHYTPTLRPPDIIERQVQCLRSLLGEGEGTIETIYLAPSDDRCGTFVARPSPEPEDEE